MFEILNGDLETYTGDSLFVGLYDHPRNFSEGQLKKLDDLFQGELMNLAKDQALSGRLNKVTVLYTLGKLSVKKIIFVGLGKEKELTTEGFRETTGRAFKKVRSFKMANFAILLDSFISKTFDIDQVASLLSETFTLAHYQYDGYKQKTNEPDIEVEKITFLTDTNTDQLNQLINAGFIYGQATNHARTLVNTPGNLLTATDLAEYARNLADKYDFEIEILEKEDLEKLGMGALLAVNQGSKQPPKMIVLKYQAKDEWTDVIGLVGKGITFDTGGYSLKPKDSIVGMKTDMGGAAAVLGAMEIIGELQPKQNVVAVIPSTDNMISGEALKPDDVITSLSGKTIEILNTDAEGRLVLADAVTYAKQHGANYLVDVATLTGGVIIALGNDKTGALSNDGALFDQFLQASKKTDEFVWRFPCTEKDKQRVRGSDVADLNNSPGREGHAIMAGTFIGEFAEDTPWIHLDIAGTSVTSKPTEIGPSGATGVMTRSLAQFVIDFQ